ncbi:peptidoglycan DD-metalloendopeptidase family protein [Ornithinibacillus sp. L9]|uniref:Peptidoglycan DD-metalloendopeptidase family protein n=2 Tax=Ornithinibacillus caprae TaxID=2678566 RepID=A0A6N8FG20_9BACI|nr:M23 family metallopeptidase [Ornithinibacillus caprae]MUK88161.1 peptidoglycan DD-metalloendopeptidase family protein [Ornithinibacillus caprae]
MFKRITIATSLALIFTYGSVYADDEKLETVYHVYVDGEHIGKVNDRTIVEDILEDTLASQVDKYEEEIDITIGEDVSIVSEKVFNPKFNNDYVTSFLEDELTIKAESVQLKIGDNVVGYFNDQETAKQVIENYKAKYVGQEILDKIQSTDQAVLDADVPKTANVPKEINDLKVGDSIILDVTLSEEVSFSDEKIEPDEILTVKQGLELLEKGTLTEETHEVQEGEVLGEIASNYNLTTKKLLELNLDLTEDSLLQIGQELNVTELKPFVDVVVIKEEKQEETISYQTEVEESDEIYKGEEEVKQNGSDGKKEVHYQVVIRNGKVTEREVLEEKTTKEPVDEVIVKGTKVISSRGTGSLSWPAVGGYVSSHVGQRWGRMHKGIDIARPSNRSILAADNGVVTEARYDGGLGNKIVINHNNGLKTVYGHLSSIDVSVGQTVEKGMKIGVMGSTGNSTGVHLHFEVYKNGSLQNPMDYLK